MCQISQQQNVGDRLTMSMSQVVETQGCLTSAAQKGKNT